MVAGPQGIADHGVFIDARQASRLANPATILEVLEDGQGAVVRQPGAEQGAPLPLAEALLAGAAGEHAAGALAVAEGDAEVALAAPAVVGTLRVLTAEPIEFVHERPRAGNPSERWTTSRWDCRKAARDWQR
jgi:hypothetical protein